MSEDQIDRRVRSGTWPVVHPGVHRTAETVLTARARIRAAWLWAGDEVLDRYPQAKWRTAAGRLLVSAAEGEAESERVLVALVRQAGIPGGNSDTG